MKGIDILTQRILAEARQEAESTVGEGRTRADAIRYAADKDAAELLEKRIALADAEAQKRYDQLLAAADTQAKKASLARKQELVSRAFALAVEKLRTMEPSRYIALLASLAAKASETGTEQIFLNPADREALGGQVVAEANRLSGGSMTLAAESREIVGGLILSQGNIEVNCSLDTLAELRRNELSAEAAGKLFG